MEAIVVAAIAALGAIIVEMIRRGNKRTAAVHETIKPLSNGFKAELFGELREIRADLAELRGDYKAHLTLVHHVPTQRSGDG